MGLWANFAKLCNAPSIRNAPVLPVHFGGTGAKRAGSIALANLGLETKRIQLKISADYTSAYHRFPTQLQCCVASLSGATTNGFDSFVNSTPDRDGVTKAQVCVSDYYDEQADYTFTELWIYLSEPLSRDMYYQVDVMYVRMD